MQCEEIALELDAYLSGELDSSLSADIERHIRQCSHCSAELEKIRKENALYKKYGSSVDIPSRSWIDSRLKMTRSSADTITTANSNFQSTLPRWLGAAAAIIILAAGLLWYFHAHQNAPEIVETQEPEPPIEAVASIDQSMIAIEQAIASLQTSYAEKKQQLDPDLVKELDRNLELTHAAIIECKQVLEKNPGDDRVVEFLMHDYEKQLDILKQITEAL